MGQISAKFVIKVVGCLPPPPLSPPPARKHLPPPRPHSPLCSAITAALSAAKLTNQYRKTVRIQFYRNISLPSCAPETTAVIITGVVYASESSLLVQGVLTSRMARVTSTTSTICASLVCVECAQTGWTRACLRLQLSDGPTAAETIFGQNNPCRYRLPPDIRLSDGFQDTLPAPASFTGS